MDPTEILLRPLPFSHWREEGIPHEPKKYLGGTTPQKLQMGILGIEGGAVLIPRLEQLQVQLDNYKNRFQILKGQGRFEAIRDQTNPYESLKSGPFFNRAGLKLANIDAVFHLTYSEGGMGDPQNYLSEYHFATLADGPGSFVQYFQYRNPLCTGVGVTLKKVGKDESLNWNLDMLDVARFTPYNGDGVGDLTTEAETIVTWCRNRWNDGYDLVTADGGFELEGEAEYKNQEQLSARLVTSEAMVALSLVRPSDPNNPQELHQKGGHMVLKLVGCSTFHTCHLIYLISTCFEEVTLFKPVSSRPSNNELYLVSRFALGSDVLARGVNVLKSLYNHYSSGGVVNSFVEEMPEEYMKWYLEMCTFHLQRQIQATMRILKAGGVLEGGFEVPPAPEDVNPFSVLVLWNLNTKPDTKLKRRAIVEPKSDKPEARERRKGTKPNVRPFTSKVGVAPSGIQRGIVAGIGSTSVLTEALTQRKGATSGVSTPTPSSGIQGYSSGGSVVQIPPMRVEGGRGRARTQGGRGRGSNASLVATSTSTRPSSVVNPSFITPNVIPETSYVSMPNTSSRGPVRFRGPSSSQRYEGTGRDTRSSANVGRKVVSGGGAPSGRGRIGKVITSQS